MVQPDADDEFFFVPEGVQLVGLEGGTIELHPGQDVTISKDVMHRTRAPQKNRHADGGEPNNHPHWRLIREILLNKKVAL